MLLTRKESIPSEASFLHAECLSIIERWGTLKEPDNYIFPIYSIGMDERRKVEVKKQNLKNVRLWMKKIIVELGLDIAITFYYVRHSYATIMRNSGVPLEFISKHLSITQLKRLRFI